MAENTAYPPHRQHTAQDSFMESISCGEQVFSWARGGHQRQGQADGFHSLGPSKHHLGNSTGHRTHGTDAGVWQV